MKLKISGVGGEAESSEITESRPKTENPNGPQKEKGWERAMYYAGAPLISLAFFIVCLVYTDVYPFGNRMMASYDLLAQIVPFAEHYFDVFEGKASLFYSFSIAGGADVFGSLAYCMISPFSFLFLLFGKTRAVYAVPLVLGAKVACISLSSTFFVKKLFPSLQPVTVTVLSVLYTFSGYFHVANTYINWLDFMIYLPLAAVAFSRFIKTGKYLPFSLSIAAMIYACFSIACFSLLIIFLILLSYCYLAVPREKRRECVTKICLSLVLAVAVALPLIIPAFVAYMKSGRNTGLFSNLNNDVSVDHLYGKLTYVLTDGVPLVLSAYYLIACDKKDGRNKFLFVATALIFAPVLFDEVCLILNAGSYMSYSLRFGFLNSVLLLYLSCLAVEHHEADEIAFSRNKWLISCIVAVILFVIIGVTLYFMQDIIDNGKNSFVFTKGYIKEGGLLYKMYEESDFTDGFSSKFAHSIGGLEIVCFIFGAVAFAAIVTVILTKFKVMPIKAASFILIVSSLLQCGFNVYHTVAGDNNTMITYDKLQASFDEIDKREGGDRSGFRIKDYSDKISNDGPLTMHFRSYSVFSSVIDSANFEAAKFFNYGGNHVNVIKSNNGNVFSDSLLGMKYAFTDSSYVSGNRRYFAKLGEYEGFYLYENLYAFPSAFKIPGGEYSTAGKMSEAYDGLYAFLGGEGALTSVARPEVTYNEQGYFTATMRSAAMDGYVFVSGKFPGGENIMATNGSVFDENDCKDLANYFSSLGYYTSSSGMQTLSIKGEGVTEEMIKEHLEMVTVRTDKVKALSDIAHENAVTAEFGSHSITLEVEAEEDCLVFVNYFAIDGYGVKINGAKGELEKNGLGFLAAKVQKGKSEVVFKYTSPYIKFILVGIAAGGLLAAMCVLAFRYYDKLKKYIEKAADYLADVLGLFILGFGFIYPIILFLIKCVKGVF